MYNCMDDNISIQYTTGELFCLETCKSVPLEVGSELSWFTNWAVRPLGFMFVPNVKFF